MVSFSTVPVTPPTVITSPTLIAFSNWMKMPVMMSCTMRCAPKPMARPSTPAEASRGAMSSPISDSVTISVITTIMMVAALRVSVSNVCSRALALSSRSGLRR